MLWFQQLLSMLLKRSINSVRFPAALGLQILLPPICVLFAMVLAVTIGSINSDPSRDLTVENSALATSDLAIFYAQFDNTSGFDLSVSDFLFPVFCIKTSFSWNIY